MTRRWPPSTPIRVALWAALVIWAWPFPRGWRELRDQRPDEWAQAVRDA